MRGAVLAMGVLALWLMVGAENPPVGAESPITVAVLDTGVQWEHVALAGKVDIARGWTAPWIVRPGNAPGIDNSVYGHGTMVSDIASRHAQVIPVKVCSGYGQCADVPGVDVDGVVAGINYAVSTGARVINASITSTLYSQSIQDAVDNAVAHGVIVVSAAGNTGGTSQNPEDVYPLGARTGMIVVGGYDTYYDEYIRWYQSTPSSYVDVMGYPYLTASGCAVDWAAADILPCKTLYPESPFWQPYLWGTPVRATSSGTSFAAPLVTDAIVQMLQENPALGPAHVEQILRDTAIPITGCTSGCGAGRLNVAAAVEKARATVVTPTPSPTPTLTPGPTPTATATSSPTPTATATPTPSPMPTCWPPSAKRCRQEAR